MAEQDTEQTENIEEPKKKSKLIFFVIIGVVLMLIAGGGFFAYTEFFSSPLDREKGENGQPVDEEALKPVGDMFTLEPFVVNLADPQGDRYLKLKISMEVKEPKAVQRAEKLSPRLRDIVIMMISSLAFEEVMTPEGKLRIREELRTRFNRVLKPYKVENIYFSEFVIQ
ncbi:MAG: flagellar basal body-associated FliL family protein [Thermodesulfobacteriota bacterium]